MEGVNRRNPHIGNTSSKTLKRRPGRSRGGQAKRKLLTAKRGVARLTTGKDENERKSNWTWDNLTHDETFKKWGCVGRRGVKKLKSGV